MVNLRLLSAGAVLAALVGSGRASAQTVTQTTGPDIIVCNFTDVSNGTPATVNGVLYDLFAVGTTSANRGNAQINWYIGTGENRHPAISEGIYRYVPTPTPRFEQLAVSSVKHGFEALQQSDCATPNYFNFPCSSSNNGGVTLGTGCADPYCCGLNYAPGNMGPRFEINATTGLFPYPNSSVYVASSGPTRVRLTDLQAAPAGTRYFEESQYIVGDDAGVHNNNNNASWQEVSMTPAAPAPSATNFTTALTGSIHREQPAINAWHVIDPSVVVATYDVANDGRYTLACKVSGPTGGLYTYEYALHNLNSNRCGGSFIVPLPGAQNALTAVGFHGVEVVGEPNATPAVQNANDWTVAGGDANASSVAWAGPAYNGTPAVYTMSATPYKVASFVRGTGNDESANVLRWGMMFNYRFTSELAPGSAGSVAVGLWRPGAGTAFIIPNVPTPGGATVGNLTASCCTGNSCSIATQSACGAGTWGSPGTTCSPDPCVAGICCVNGVCSTSTAGTCAGAFTAAGSCSPNPCPQPTGACCPASGCVVSTQAACASGYQGDNTTCATAPCPPGNDLCANAFWIADGVAATGNTTAATNTGGNDTANACANAAASPDVWFKYRPVTSATVAVSMCGSSYDTALSLHSGNCGALSQITCNDDSCNLQSQISAALSANTTYYIRVTGYQGSTGQFTVLVTGGGGVIPPGACCNTATGACTLIAQTSCGSGSTWNGAAACSPQPCPQPAGACCSGTTCSTGTAASCVGGTAVFQGAGTACGPTGNPTTCCPANFNTVGGLNVQDIFDYLNAWFGSAAGSDFNRDGHTTVQDIFDFLTAWFGGC